MVEFWGRLINWRVKLKNDEGLKKLAQAIGCIGLAYLGFEYESYWAFIGSVLLFLCIC